MKNNKIYKAQIVVIDVSESIPLVLVLKTNKKRGGFWQNITGKIEEGEEIIDGAIREIKEETTIDISKEELIKLSLKYEFKDRLNRNAEEHCYLLKLKEKHEIQIDSSEHDDFKWVDCSKISSDIYKYESNYETTVEALKYV